jgi:pilus assembly protein CpaC
MRMIFRPIAGALLLAAAGVWISWSAAHAQGRSGQSEDAALQESVLRVPACPMKPLVKRASLGLGKSILVQFPCELKDVLVAAPEKVDAVVQSSNRVFLVAKGQGETNAFFFDSHGQQILLLEVAVGADLKGLDSILKRFVLGSRIESEMAGRAVVLSGTVRTPLDGKRAADIACQFVAANNSIGQPSVSASNVTTISSTNSGASTIHGDTRTENSTTYREKTQDQASACGSQTKLVINLLSVEGEEQVMLKVTVAEVQRSLLKQFGINLGAAINSGNFSTKLLTENALPLTAAAGLGTLPVPGLGTQGLDPTTGPTCLTQGVLCNWNPGPAPGTFGNSGVTNNFVSGNTRLTSALRALERDGLIRTLAEPNMTAVSGETANFLAGGEYPIPVVDSQGQLSVTYKKFGVGLAFTPVVMSEGRISLKIESEVSELTTDGSVVLSSISIPALKTRQAKTTVEMPSGGSLAIAGLISDSTKQNIDGFPGLKDLPMLGTLFRSHDYIKQETELVVIVTPYMVRPTARQNLARSDDGFAPASDFKADFLGHLNRVYGKRAEPPSGGLKGDYGFIVE